MALSSVSRDLRRSRFEMGSRVFTSVPALQHCPDQGKVAEVKNTKKKKKKQTKPNIPALQRVSMTTRPASVGWWSAARHFQFICFRVPLMSPPRSLGVRSGYAEKRSPSASCRLLSVARVHRLTTSFRRSRLGTARRRDPASPRDRLCASLPGRILPGCGCPRYCSRFPEPAGAAGRAGPCFGGARFPGGQRRVSAGRAGGRVPARTVTGRALGSVPGAAPGGGSQHWLSGDGTRAPRGRHRSMALSREGRLTWLWIHRVTLAESLCLGILSLRVCEEGRGGLPGPRWAWKEDTGVARCRGAAGI